MDEKDIEKIIISLFMRGIEIDSNDIYDVSEDGDFIKIYYQGEIEVDKRAIKE